MLSENLIVKDSNQNWKDFTVSIKEWLDNLRKDVGKHAALIKML